MPKPAKEKHQLVLPHSVVTRMDIGRLLREIDEVESALRRKTASKDEKLLPTSKLLEDLATHNKLNALKADDREALKDFLQTLRTEAPVMHFSFSADPSARFLSSLLDWLRREIHPQVLLQIGLEPALGAGCVIRTTNRYFDLSLRHFFDAQGDLLMGKLKEGQA